MNPNMKTVTGRFKKKIKIPKEWEFVTLGSISNIKRGASPRPIADSKYFGDGRGWIRIADVTKSGKYLEKTKQYLSPLGESKSVAVNHGDVIMSIAATIGKPIIVKMKACIHDGFVVFTNLDKDMDSEFLYYLLLKTENEFKSLGQHGTQINLNIDLVSSANFSKPSLPEQQKIGSILSNIDELIQKQQQVIDQTQKLMQGQLQRLLTQGITDTPTQTAQGKPRFRKFQISKNWDYGILGDYVEIVVGRSFDSSEYVNDGIRLLRGDNITEGELRWGLKTRFLNVSYQNLEKYLVKENDLVISMDGSKVGKNFALIKKEDTPAILNQRVARLRTNGDLDQKFLYYLIYMKRFSDYVESIKTNAAIPHIAESDIVDFVIPLPLLEEQQKIASILSNLDLLIQQEKQYKEKLEKIKRGLMQQLLTGQTRVKV